MLIVNTLWCMLNRLEFWHGTISSFIISFLVEGWNPDTEWYFKTWLVYFVLTVNIFHIKVGSWVLTMITSNAWLHASQFNHSFKGILNSIKSLFFNLNPMYRSFKPKQIKRIARLSPLLACLQKKCIFVFIVVYVIHKTKI